MCETWVMLVGMAIQPRRGSRFTMMCDFSDDKTHMISAQGPGAGTPTGEELRSWVGSSLGILQTDRHLDDTVHGCWLGRNWCIMPPLMFTDSLFSVRARISLIQHSSVF